MFEHPHSLSLHLCLLDFIQSQSATCLFSTNQSLVATLYSILSLCLSLIQLTFQPRILATHLHTITSTFKTQTISIQTRDFHDRRHHLDTTTTVQASDGSSSHLLICLQSRSAPWGSKQVQVVFSTINVIAFLNLSLYSYSVSVLIELQLLVALCHVGYTICTWNWCIFFTLWTSTHHS